MLKLWTPDSADHLRKSVAESIRKEKVAHEVIPLSQELPTCPDSDLLFAMGGEALSILAAEKIVPRNRTIGSLRGSLIQHPDGGKIMLSYQASIGEVDRKLHTALQCDLMLACRYVKTGSMHARLGRYEFHNDLSVALKFIELEHANTGKKVSVAFDTETLSLNPYDPETWIVSVQVSWAPGLAHVVRFKSKEESEAGAKGEVGEQIRKLLTLPYVKLCGANLKYDLNWLAVKWGIHKCTNFTLDTTLVGSLLDENRSNSLNLHAKVYCPDLGGYDDPLNDRYDKGRMDLVPDEDFLPYAGGDVDACLRISQTVRKELFRDERLTNFYVNILHPAARAYENVEQVGWCVDKPYYEHLRDELETEIARLEKEARSLLGRRLVLRHEKKDGSLNLTKKALLVDFLFSKAGLNLTPKMWTAGGKDGTDKQIATSKAHLKMFRDDPDAGPFIRAAQEYSVVSKMHKTYVVGFLKSLKADGRFHPTYFLFAGQDFMSDSDEDRGAVTGRLSVIDPAIQTVPKRSKTWAKKIRRAFIAPPGHVILANDYEQGELKIIACVAPEPAMLRAYLAGLDLHVLTAASVSGLSVADLMAMRETDPAQFEFLRTLAKSCNFGLAYGLGAEGYQMYAVNNYDVVLALQDAAEKRDAFFRGYPGLTAWHNNRRALLRRQGFIRSPLGRIRHLPLIWSRNREVAAAAERQGINAEIQSTLSDMSLWSTALIRADKFARQAPVFGMVHDQLLTYAPEDQYEAHARKRKEIMENLPFHELGWQPQLRFTADCEVGPNLGSLEKLKLN